VWMVGLPNGSRRCLVLGLSTPLQRSISDRSRFDFDEFAQAPSSTYRVRVAMASETGFLTRDFVLRVILPGGLIFFLFLLLAPDLRTTLDSTAFIALGLFAFLVLGFLSYSIYRASYLLLCRG